MFDPVTDEVLRRRRMGVTSQVPVQEPAARSSRICSVCQREIRPEEDLFWVAGEVHCYQCHGMLEFEYSKERKVDKEMREAGTRWRDKDGE
jgi:hypothetical protein